MLILGNPHSNKIELLTFLTI